MMRAMMKLSAISYHLSARNGRKRLASPFFRRAFTLTELLVVLAILALVATLAVPAMGPMFASNQTASVISTLSAMMVTAQSTAKAQGTPVALRIEPAFKTDDRGFMVNAAGQTPFGQGVVKPWDLAGVFVPVPLGYQQVRIVQFAPKQQATGTAVQAFVLPNRDAKPVALPKDIWVTAGDWVNPNPSLIPSIPSESQVTWKPGEGIAFSELDTFYVVFNASGELVRYSADKCYYLDYSQQCVGGVPLVDYPIASTLSIVAYDRNRWKGIDPQNGSARYEFLCRTGVPVYINRHTGAVLEEKR